MAKVKNQQPTPEVTEQLAQQFSFIEKNAKTITISVIAVIVIIVGIILYNNYVVEPRENEASTAIAKGQDLFGAQQFEPNAAMPALAAILLLSTAAQRQAILLTSMLVFAMQSLRNGRRQLSTLRSLTHRTIR